MSFVLKLMDCVMKLMSFVLKLMDCVMKLMSFAFKLMDCVIGGCHALTSHEMVE